MFGLGLATKIYIAVEAVDMRKGFEGLYGLVRDSKSPSAYPFVQLCGGPRRCRAFYIVRSNPMRLV